MEEQGDLRSGGDVTEGPAGLPPRRPVARTRPLVSEPHGGRGPLIAGCRCPAGVKGRPGHSPGERGRLGPERTPAKSPALAPVAPVDSPGSCHGAWSCSRGPRLAAGECLLQTPSTGGRGCLHGEGGWSLGDRGLSGHSRFLRSLDQTLESGSRQVQFCLMGAGGGQFEPGQDS